MNPERYEWTDYDKWKAKEGEVSKTPYVPSKSAHPMKVRKGLAYLVVLTIMGLGMFAAGICSELHDWFGLAVFPLIAGVFAAGLMVRIADLEEKC